MSSCAAIKNVGYVLVSEDSVLDLLACHAKLRDSPSSSHPHVSSGSASGFEMDICWVALHPCILQPVPMSDFLIPANELCKPDT